MNAQISYELGKRTNNNIPEEEHVDKEEHEE
jgi:hypothetical protein